MLNLPAGLIFRTAMLKVTKKKPCLIGISPSHESWQIDENSRQLNIDLGIKTIDLYMGLT